VPEQCTFPGKPSGEKNRAPGQGEDSGARFLPGKNKISLPPPAFQGEKLPEGGHAGFSRIGGSPHLGKKSGTQKGEDRGELPN